MTEQEEIWKEWANEAVHELRCLRGMPDGCGGICTPCALRMEHDRLSVNDYTKTERMKQ